MTKEVKKVLSLGQDDKIWRNSWDLVSPESEIRKWDFYGLRPWILKYTPRNGKVLEAGCGLGRWNFYLSNLGIDIEGLDFSGETINSLKAGRKTMATTYHSLKAM